MIATISETKMCFEENRLATFKKWIFSDTVACNAKKLAEAGFYFNGDENEPDSVQCFFCSKSLDGWEPEDDPWKEHLKHASYCNFAQKGLTEKEYTCLQFIDLMRDLSFNKIKKLLEESKNEHEDYNNVCLDVIARIPYELFNKS